MSVGFNVDTDKCTECLRCAGACSVAKIGVVQLAASRVKVLKAWPKAPEIRQCPRWFLRMPVATSSAIPPALLANIALPAGSSFTIKASFAPALTKACPPKVAVPEK